MTQEPESTAAIGKTPLGSRSESIGAAIDEPMPDEPSGGSVIEPTELPAPIAFVVGEDSVFVDAVSLNVRELLAALMTPPLVAVLLMVASG
jgi:hypothetical protein